MRHVKIWSLSLLGTLIVIVITVINFHLFASLDSCHMKILYYIGSYTFVSNVYNYYVGVSKL